MKKFKLVLALMITLILVIVTLPITIVVYAVANGEYSWSDYYNNVSPPKYLTKWNRFLLSPLTISGFKPLT